MKLDTLKESEKNEMKLKVNEDTELNVSVMIKYKFNSGNKGGTNGNEGKEGMNSGNAGGGGGGIMSRLKMFDKSFKGANPTPTPTPAPIAGRQPSKTVVNANTNVPKVNVEEKVNNSSSSSNNNNTVKNETSVNDSNKVNNNNNNTSGSSNSSNANNTNTTTPTINSNNNNSNNNNSNTNTEGTENLCRSGTMSVLQQAKLISQHQSTVKKDEYKPLGIHPPTTTTNNTNPTPIVPSKDNLKPIINVFPKENLKPISNTNQSNTTLPTKTQSPPKTNSTPIVKNSPTPTTTTNVSNISPVPPPTFPPKVMPIPPPTFQPKVMPIPPPTFPPKVIPTPPSTNIVPPVPPKPIPQVQQPTPKTEETPKPIPPTPPKTEFPKPVPPPTQPKPIQQQPTPQPKTNPSKPKPIPSQPEPSIINNPYMRPQSRTVKPKPTPSSKQQPSRPTPSSDAPVFLSSVPYTPPPKHVYPNTFCEGFFIASFPQLKAKVIENSQAYPSICGHDDCSMLPAMESEIIYRYPLKDTKTLEMNNLAATICFPTGIKVCYQESSSPSTIKNYASSITNQTGDRYYMMTYHFYHKIQNSKYTSQYEMHPLKHHLMKFADDFVDKDDLDKKEIEAIQDNLDICQEFGFRENVYVPYCVCLISKYPYTNQLEKCLQSIFSVLSDISNTNSEKELNDIILFLIHSLPIPTMNTSVRFFIPFCNTSLDLSCPKYKDIELVNVNLSFLLTLFSPEDIVNIWRMMLFEKKILFVDTDYNRLSEVMASFISLLYPLSWVHTYIPIMSDQMIKYLETFLPFMNGINASLMNYVQNTLEHSEEEVYIINLEKKEIGVNLQWKNKTLKAITQLNYTTPRIPAKCKLLLEQELKSIRESMQLPNDDNNNNNNSSSVSSSVHNRNSSIDIRIKNAFIDTFARMFFDYKKYLNVVDNDAVFNGQLFIEKRSKDDKVFYSELIETQLFLQFIQTIAKEDFIYFNSRIALIHDRNIKKTETHQKMIDNILKVNTMYVIKPSFTSTTSNELPAIVKDVTNLYYSRINKNKNIVNDYENGIFKVDKRVTDKTIQILEENYDISTLTMYVLPSSQNETIKQKAKDNNTSTPSTKDEAMSKERFRFIENLKENLKDTVISIFKSEITSDDLKDKKKEIMQYIREPIGREFFVNLIYNNTKSEVKILKQESYNFLLFLVNNTLLLILTLEQNEANITQAVQVFKCSTTYGYQETKTKINLIWNELMKKVKEGLQLPNRGDFWKCWIDVTVSEYEKEGKDYSVENVIFSDIVDNMIKMGLEKQFMKLTIEGIVKEKITKDTQEVERIKAKLGEALMKANYRKKGVVRKKKQK